MQKLDLQALSVILVVQGSENWEHTGCCLWENDLLHLLLLWRWGWLAAQVRGSILESRWAVTCLVLISPSFPSVLTKVITLLPWTCHYWICSLCLQSPVPLRPYKNKVTRWKKHGGPVRKQMLEAVLKQNFHSFIIHSSIHPSINPSTCQIFFLSVFSVPKIMWIAQNINVTQAYKKFSAFQDRSSFCEPKWPVPLFCELQKSSHPKGCVRIYLCLLVSPLSLGAAVSWDSLITSSPLPLLLQELSVLWFVLKHKHIFFLHCLRLLFGGRGEQVTVAP